ncbi:MAG: heavy metal translocating P-type ATPase [Eubacteriales bacterium]
MKTPRFPRSFIWLRKRKAKGPIAKLADIISGYFVPAVLGIAVLSARHLSWLEKTLNCTQHLRDCAGHRLSVCAGSCDPDRDHGRHRQGAELGVLIKGGEALETTHGINAVVLDKTGTITRGKPELTDIVRYTPEEEASVLTLTASAERGSEHPIARAIVQAAQARNLNLQEPDMFRAIPGRGIEAVVGGRRVLAGSAKLLTENNVDISRSISDAVALSNAGKTLMYIALDNALYALMAAADAVKPTSRAAVEQLKSLGLDVYMLTGDNAATAKAVAESVGIDHVLSDVLPDGKANEVQKLQEQGKRVAMVGDGINDAPALVQADVGMAIGTGTDVAVESADVVLMRGDLSAVSAAVALSRATIRNIRQNLFWAFAYNVVGIPFAAGVFFAFGGPLLTPMFAGAAMALSSVSVVTNALRLKRFRLKEKK